MHGQEHREEKRDRQRNKRQSARESRRKGIFRMIGIVGDAREMRSAVGWNRLYSNGVAIRVMLEYIDYWGDQRVGDDGMTPVLNSREEDEGSKQLVLPCYPVSPRSLAPFHPPFIPSSSGAASNIRQPPRLIFDASSVPSCFTTSLWNYGGSIIDLTARVQSNIKTYTQ